MTDEFALPPSRKHLPEIVERRRRLARWVKGIVGACVVICAAAVVAGLMSDAHAGEPAAVRAPSKVADDVMQKAAPAALSRKAH